MILGIVALAMVVGGSAAVATLIAGQSVLMALAVYSGCGTLGALFLGLIFAAKAVWVGTQEDGARSDAPA